ncbi:MAG: acetyl-CoA C-acetyltransferase [Betaproteobacteria bacterium]|nr:acetyl-CoA C-acetyltransferase [Betaproteobacteria bacterium]
MSEAYIVDAIRTAGGRRGGRLAGWHPVDLAAQVLDALVARSHVDPALVDDVFMGCVMQVGEQAVNVARNAVLASRLPLTVPGTTIDRQCGSSQQALHFAAQAVMAGVNDVVIAAGVESMTRVPMFSASILAQKAGMGFYQDCSLRSRYPEDFSQFTGAEMMAKQHGFTKDALDEFALNSHRKATAAIKAGAFESEIVPVEVRPANEPGTGEMHTVDEGVRQDASLTGIQSVKLLREGGVITAANASQICDGASGLLVVNERGLKALGAKPLARIHHMSVLGYDPVVMLDVPLAATRRALQRSGMKIDDIDLYEVNEAFAPVPMAWLKTVGGDPAKLNVNGGAIALGHPLGATGAKLMATLVHSLHRHGKRFGLQTMCEGGGMANVTIVERL